MQLTKDRGARTMNVWKVASRWSNTGTKESSILDIFRKYGIVFAGRQTDKIINKVKKGDLIAISDGLKIVSVAKVISNPTKITNFIIEDEDKQKFDYNDWVVGFKVEIYNLGEEEIFKTRQGTFHGMGQYSDRVKKLFNNKIAKNDFQIKSYTYNLYDVSNASLIQKNLKYIVPIYQRPYSWNESQIETFINDIFISYWGTDKQVYKESMFIGTMQLSDKKYSDKDIWYQEIIDGQQRITTLTLLLKLLSNKYPNNTFLKQLKFDWLDTDVNKGQQSQQLKEVLDKNQYCNELNKYAINYKLLDIYVEQNITLENEDSKFDENDFIEYLVTKLYFVIIETKAGLSKTLQIFNAINTTGLDLDNTDIFKIKLYEYLSNNGDDKEIFNKIDELYEKIEIKNDELGYKLGDMNDILSIYKSYLISKYNLNITLWRMATGTFYERLFDTILNIKQWSGFSELKNKDNLLKIEDIDKIIDIKYKWEHRYYTENGKFDNFDTMLSLRLLWWSRYSNYWTLGFLYLFIDEDNYEKYNRLIQELSRLYITYTLIYQKQVNEIHKFTKDIFKNLIADNHSIDEILIRIKEKYLQKQTNINDIIDGDIFWNPKIKNILTRMCASIDEYKNSKSIKDIEKLIFETKVDIEHIKSRNDLEFEDEAVKQEWNGILNTIGNLMILEYKINRSIGNKPFDEKIKEYKESQYSIVKNFEDNYSKWNYDNVLERKEIEKNKIINFIYNKIS